VFCFLSDYVFYCYFGKGYFVMRKRDSEANSMNLIGDRVVKKRTELHLHQKDVVEALKEKGVFMTLSSYSKVEGKLRRVSDFELVALAKVFNVSISWLCGSDV